MRLPLSHSALRLTATAAVACTALFAVCASASAASPARPSPNRVAAGAQPPRHAFGRGTSTNWSGYDVTGGSATRVAGTWTAPAVTCAPGENSWSSPWVGLDGDTSNTVEQIGTDSDCQSGQPVYYAWYEMYPKSLVTLGLTVVPGHSYTGAVAYSGSGAFTLSLTDNSTHVSTSTRQTSRKARLASAEWIMEGPSSNGLSDFGTVPFSAATAAINGQSGALGSLSGFDPITMVDSHGSVRAQPSGLGAGGASFTVTWKHA